MWASSNLSMGCCQVFSPISQLPDQALPSIETEVKEEFPPPQQFNRRQAPSTPDLSEDSAPESPQIFRGDSSPLNRDGSGVDGLGDTEPRHFTNELSQSLPSESEDPNANEDLPSLLEKFSVKRNTPGSTDALITPPPSKKRRTERQSTVEFFRESDELLLDTKKNHGPRRDRWSFDEREALCLLYIFCNCDNAFKDIAKILCVYFQEPFRARQVRAQWDTYGYIFRKRSVYNPRKAWMDKRTGFEAAATRAGIELELRPVELKARKLNPKSTTVVEKVAKYDAWFLGQLVRRRDGYQARSRATQRPDTPQSMDPVSPLASKSSDGNSSALLELLEAAESTTPPVLEEPIQPGVQEMPAPKLSQPPETGSEPSLPWAQAQGLELEPESPESDAPPSSGGPPLFTSQRSTPTLLYRVYHDNSGGANSPTLFRAGLFNIPGKSLAPPPETHDLLPVFVSWHLWHHSLSSPFISCTDSLIMATHKARTAEADGLNPHIAVIDAAAALSARHGYHAGPLVAQARKRGLVPGMRYQGYREWLIWGEIAAPAILHDLPFAALRSLTVRDIGVADLLALDDVDPAGSISRIRKGLLRQEVLLDAAGGHALGRLAVLFGLHVGTAPAMVGQFVFGVLQGWVLGVVEEGGEVERMAGCFVDGIKSAEVAGRSAVVVMADDEEEEALKAAFVSGVERASRELEKERRPARR